MRHTQSQRDKPKKIVYLFGAGATQAELTSCAPDLRSGLLVRDVSSRVVEKARKKRKYLSDLKAVSGKTGSLNIELLISLIENSKVRGWEYKTRLLKRLVKADIKRILTPAHTSQFYLHKALLEYHEQPSIQKREELLGLISLNYDGVLDQAYVEIFRKPVNYCLWLDSGSPRSRKVPLLKLHGSFNWSRIGIRDRLRNIEIIPMGSSKSYLHAPYGCIWNRALEILVNCDILRVIGCSLNQNDAHLVDLLFKAQLERVREFELHIIDRDIVGDEIRKNYGFFPTIRILSDIGGVSGADTLNPFHAWLKDYSISVPNEQMVRTRYLKRVVRSAR